MFYRYLRGSGISIGDRFRNRVCIFVTFVERFGDVYLEFFYRRDFWRIYFFFFGSGVSGSGLYGYRFYVFRYYVVNERDFYKKFY